MDRTTPPVSLNAALALPRTPGRSAEVFVDGDLEVRFAARPTDGPQVPHERDELYFVAAGTGRYPVEDKVTAVGPGDLLFCAAHVAHGFEDISADFVSGCCSTGRRNSRPSLRSLSALPRKQKSKWRALTIFWTPSLRGSRRPVVETEFILSQASQKTGSVTGESHADFGFPGSHL